MILFKVKADGSVTSTPSRLPQGIAIADLVVITEAEYGLVTAKIIPPSGEQIPNVIFVPERTEGSTLWMGNLPAEATLMSGIMTYQLFLTMGDGRVIPTNRYQVRVDPGVITNMPETADGLGKYSIADLFNLLANTYSVVESVNESIVSIEPRVKLRMVELTDDNWKDGSWSFGMENVVPPNKEQYRTTLLLVPQNEATRDAAQNAEVSVDAIYNTETAVSNFVTVKIKPRGTEHAENLVFTVVILQAVDHFNEGENSITAQIVGVANLTDALMDREVGRVLTNRIPTSVDMSNVDGGAIVETFADGSTKTTTLVYDEDGNPVKITDGDGNVTDLTW